MNVISNKRQLGGIGCTKIDRPVYHKPYRPSLHERSKVLEIGNELKEVDVNEDSQPPYSPCLLVKKKTGNVCVNYRALNKITVKDYYPFSRIPRINDQLGLLHNNRYFNSLDFHSDVEKSKSKTAFVPPPLMVRISSNALVLVCVTHHQLFKELLILF